MLEVITHGGGEGLAHAFNAIAVLFKNKGVMANIFYILFNFAILVATTQMVITQDAIRAFKWAVAFVFLINAFMLPKVNIMVIDRAALFQRKVDNVPFMLGFAASFSSKLGDVLAKTFDQAFSPVELGYSKTGVAMSSKLVSNLSRMPFPHPDVGVNLRTFVQQCMVMDVALGKYTIRELKETNDLWEFLAKQASPIRAMPYSEWYPSGRKATKTYTCKEVAEKETQNWANYLPYAAQKYGSLLFPEQRQRAGSLLLEYLPISYNYLTGMSQSADNLLRQNIMRNLIRDGLIELNAINGTTDVIKSYAIARAQEQQKAAYSLHGEMASLSLSTLKVIFEVLIYSLFPMAVSIALFPGGLRVLKEYALMMFSIQAWAPMYAILNMILNVYAKSKSIAAVTLAGAGSAQAAVSFSTIPRLVEANEWISAVAGYGMGLIPFLSYGIFKYGAGALTQISSHFGSIAQSALGHAAEEATTGNMSIGNRNFDNHSQSNTHAFKQDTNVSVAAGRTTVQELDGSLSTRMADGQVLYDTSPVMPKLNSSIKMSDSLATAFNESASQSIQSARQDSNSAVKNTTAAFNTLNEFRKSRAQDTSHAETYNRQESALKETAFGQYDDLVKKFADESKIDVAKAHQLFLETSGGFRIPGFGGISGGVKGSRTETDTELFSKAEDYSKKYGMSDMLRNAVQEAKEGRLSFLNTENSHYGDTISSGLNQSDSNIRSAQASLNKADYYQQQANHIKQSGISIDQDLTKQYWDTLVSEFGAAKAKEIVSNPVANYEHIQQFSKAKRNQLVQQFEQQRPVDVFSVEQKYQKDQAHISSNNNLEQTIVRNKEPVLAKRDNAELTQPVNPSLKQEVNKSLEKSQKELEKQREDINKEGLKVKNKVDDKINNNDFNSNTMNDSDGIYTKAD